MLTMLENKVISPRGQQNIWLDGRSSLQIIKQKLAIAPDFESASVELALIFD